MSLKCLEHLFINHASKNTFQDFEATAACINFHKNDIEKYLHSTDRFKQWLGMYYNNGFKHFKY